MPSVGKLLAFIAENKALHQREDFIRRLSTLTVAILAESNDSPLHDLLKRSGFDSVELSYPLDVDVEKLVISLKKLEDRRNHRLSLVRSSQIGLKNTIKSFAPDMLMSYTLEKGFHLDGVSLKPYSVFFDGVCLLADISGFTRLSGQYCSGGRDGIDELQQATNGYLGELVKTVYSYGGDVLKFAGDALVCVFQSRRYTDSGIDLVLADICSNSVQCATELAQICTPHLTIHVAVSCGPMCFAMLGGHNDVWESLVSGACLGDISQCLDDAKSKQTVISQKFVETLGPMYRRELKLEPLPSGNFRVISASSMNTGVVQKMIKKRAEMLLQDCEARFSAFPNDPEFITALRRFVPTPVAQKLISGSFDYLAELREVTTMFMSWDSYDDVIHHDLLVLQTHFLIAEKVLAESGGFIRQFLIDDKGCVLIACWGVPTASHPDNTRRALCAGAIIGYKLSEIGMKTSVGITTGNVFCGSVGSYVRREYAVIGDVVNLAARLMSKAKGGLFIDEATYDRIPAHLQRHLEKLPPIAVKGKDELVTPYSLRAGVGRLSLDDKGVNEKHIDALTIRPICKVPLLEGMRRIQKKVPVNLRFVIIEGKTGTEKYEILEWLKLTGSEMDIKILCLKLSCKDKLSDYHLAKNLFRLLVGAEVFDDTVRQQIMIKNLLKKVYKKDKETIGKVAYPAMATALGIESPNKIQNTPQAARLPPRLLNQCLRDIFTFLLCESPLVVLIGSMHFADMLSWDVVVNLVNIPSMAMLVLTMERVVDIELAKIKFAPDNLREEIFTVENANEANSSSLFLNRLKLNHKKLCGNKGTKVVIMNDYSIPEVEQLLTSVLGSDGSLERVALMVHKLSGGNPFWCKEMALFIHTTGAEEFMRAMEPCDLNTSSTHKDSMDPRDISRNTSKKKRPNHSGHSTSFYTFRSKDFPHTKCRSNSGKSSVESCVTDFLNHKIHASSDDGRTLEIGNGNEMDNNLASSGTTSKLELFIVCRLEKLNREDQNILRIASIIGDVFSTEILYGVLPPKLRTHMANSIASLVDNQWITEMPTDSGQFNFVHPLFFQTLYDVTPAGERARLHYAIGSCFEEKYDGDPLYFAQIGHHFGLAKNSRPKALENFVRASVYSMSKGPLYFDEGLELLIQSKLFADVAEDCQTMLSVVMCNRTKLLTMRRRLRDEEEKRKRDNYQNCVREKMKNEIHNKFQDHNEVESDNESVARSVALEPRPKKRFFNCNLHLFERRVSPHDSATLTPDVLADDDGVNENDLEAYKPDGCGLTIIGTDIFIKLFCQVEEELTKLHAEMLKMEMRGAIPDWQKSLREQMRAENGRNDENSSSRNLLKKQKRNVLVLAAGSIKIISNAVEGQKGSLLNLLGKSNSALLCVDTPAMNSSHLCSHSVNNPNDDVKVQTIDCPIVTLGAEAPFPVRKSDDITRIPDKLAFKSNKCSIS